MPSLGCGDFRLFAKKKICVCFSSFWLTTMFPVVPTVQKMPLQNLHVVFLILREFDRLIGGSFDRWKIWQEAGNKFAAFFSEEHIRSPKNLGTFLL